MFHPHDTNAFLCPIEDTFSGALAATDFGLHERCRTPELDPGDMFEHV